MRESKSERGKLRTEKKGGRGDGHKKRKWKNNCRWYAMFEEAVEIRQGERKKKESEIKEIL